MKSLLAAVVLTASAAPALAEHSLPVVDASVTSVVFDRGTQTRAIAGGDRDGAFLGIQRVVRGTITDEMSIEELPIGGDNVPLSELKNLRLVSLSGGALVFEVAPRVRGARATIQCTAQLAFEKRRVRVRSASCNDDADATTSTSTSTYTFTSTSTSDDGVGDHRPHGMSDLEAATTACGEAFEYSKDRKACVDTAIAPTWGRFAASAPAAVGACKDAFDYSNDRLACVQFASRSTREPAALVSYCRGQNDYSKDRLACIEKYGSLKP